MTWVLAEDEGDAEHVAEVIGALDDALRRERAAIARLDAAAVESLAQEKQRLAEELGHLLTPAPGEPIVARFASPSKERQRRELRRLAARLLASAEANRALLHDAIDSIATARGLKPAHSGAYDARARITPRMGSSGGKRI